MPSRTSGGWPPPRGFWREVPCGHPKNPVAAIGPDGPVCHCGLILNPKNSMDLLDPVDGISEIVPCSQCGCGVGIPPAPGPEHHTYSIAVDFDGVIHSYTSKWVSADVIPDPPVEGAIAWLNDMSRKFRVIIFTTRGKAYEGQQAVKLWLREHGYEAPSIEVTAEKPPALIYLDDRAVRFDGKHFPTADQIHRELIPWNKAAKAGA
jgi:hypothetical protein